MLVINPEECIDCGVCVSECPAKAIVPETLELISWVKFNSDYAKMWPRITTLLRPPSDADSFNGMPDKMSLFSAKAGNGHPLR